MKSLLILVVIAFILSCTGCGTTSVIVVDKKEQQRPFSKVLIVYLNDPCSYTVLDSIAYDICLRSSFIQPDSQGIKSRAEKMLAEDLGSSGTAIVRSSDLFNATNSNYEDFKKTVTSQGIDAILLVNRHAATARTQYKTMINGVWYTSDDPKPGARIVRQYDGAFECSLIKPQNIYFPVWKAELEIKGTAHNNVKMLDRKVTRALRQTLEKGEYVAH